MDENEILYKLFHLFYFSTYSQNKTIFKKVKFLDSVHHLKLKFYRSTEKNLPFQMLKHW